MKYLYKLPQRKFPYDQLVAENAKRGKLEREYQLMDTGIFEDDRYFDCFIEVAKEDPDELLFRCTAYNRGPEAAPLHIIPQVWFRNTWSWKKAKEGKKPSIKQIAPLTAQTTHEKLAHQFVQLSPSPGVGNSEVDIVPRMLFTENDTNVNKLYGSQNCQPYVVSLFRVIQIRLGPQGGFSRSMRYVWMIRDALFATWQQDFWIIYRTQADIRSRKMLFIGIS